MCSWFANGIQWCNQHCVKTHTYPITQAVIFYYGLKHFILYKEIFLKVTISNAMINLWFFFLKAISIFPPLRSIVTSHWSKKMIGGWLAVHLLCYSELSSICALVLCSSVFETSKNFEFIVIQICLHYIKLKL